MRGTTAKIILSAVLCSSIAFIGGFLIGINETDTHEKTKIRCGLPGKYIYLESKCAAQCGDTVLYTTKMTGPAKIAGNCKLY